MKKVHKLWLFMCSWMLRNLLWNGDPAEGRNQAMDRVMGLVFVWTSRWGLSSWSMHLTIKIRGGFTLRVGYHFSLGPIFLEYAFDDKNTRRFHFKSWISPVAVLARLLQKNVSHCIGLSLLVCLWLSLLNDILLSKQHGNLLHGFLAYEAASLENLGYGKAIKLIDLITQLGHELFGLELKQKFDIQRKRRAESFLAWNFDQLKPMI